MLEQETLELALVPSREDLVLLEALDGRPAMGLS